MPWIRATACCSVSLFSTSSRATALVSAACCACSDVRMNSARLRRAALREIVNSWSTEVQNCASELGDVLASARCGVARRQSRFNAQRVVQVHADALELPAPCFERIWLVAVQHVSHRQPQSRSGFAECAEAAASLCGCGPRCASAGLKARDLVQRVEREHRDRGQRDGQAGQQAIGRRRDTRCSSASVRIAQQHVSRCLALRSPNLVSSGFRLFRILESSVILLPSGGFRAAVTHGGIHL